MTTTKESDMDQNERITQLLRASQQRGIDAGTRVRCPVCNAGIGKYCLVDMDDPMSRPIRHEVRVALQRETLGDLQPDAVYG